MVAKFFFLGMRTFKIHSQQLSNAHYSINYSRHATPCISQTFLISVSSQLPSAQNNPYSKVACLGVAYSATLHLFFQKRGGFKLEILTDKLAEPLGVD